MKHSDSESFESIDLYRGDQVTTETDMLLISNYVGLQRREAYIQIKFFKESKMPNWCQNTLTITGEESIVSDFRSRAMSPLAQAVEDGANERTDMSDLDPPKKIGSAPSDEEVSPLSFESLVPSPQRLKERSYGGEAEARLEGLTDDTWREDPEHNLHAWQVANWGCKWGANVIDVSQYSPDEIVYEFDTPWSPPLAFLKSASKIFPALSFRLSFTEDDGDLAGEAECENGEFDVYYRTMQCFDEDENSEESGEAEVIN